MNYEGYNDIKFTSDLQQFVFVSVGPCGQIRKRVAFTPTEWPGIYNMAFGDIGRDDEIDDFVVSNNGDRRKILATIVRIIELYTNNYPERVINFTGSTPGRTRLYRMAISLNLEILSKKFEIYAEVKGNEIFVPYQKNMPALAFLVKRKF